jgi:hypothetical protein
MEDDMHVVAELPDGRIIDLGHLVRKDYSDLEEYLRESGIRIE